jgi:hypothetical protein
MEVFTAFAGELESSIAWGSGGLTTLGGAVARVQRKNERRRRLSRNTAAALVHDEGLAHSRIPQLTNSLSSAGLRNKGAGSSWISMSAPSKKLPPLFL